MTRLDELDYVELLLWLSRSEDTGHYMGYSRHAIALEIAKRTK